MSGPKKNTMGVGIAVAVLVVAALVSVGYYQYQMASAPTTSPTSTGPVVCTPSTCAYANLTSGAALCNNATVKVCGFSPPTITVVLGVNNTVFWRNLDPAPHTVTGSAFGSPNMNFGNTYQHTFTQSGNYSYICSYHSWMKANVIVKAG